MATIKQRSTQNGTIKLKRLKNDRKDLSSGEYKYVIEYGDGDRTSPLFNKQQAMSRFKKEASARSGGGGGSMGMGTTIGDMLGF